MEDVARLARLRAGKSSERVSMVSSSHGSRKLVSVSRVEDLALRWRDFRSRTGMGLEGFVDGIYNGLDLQKS